MAMDEGFAQDVLFSLWSPITAVTVASGERKNAFIASSVTCASFAPPNPMRLTVQMMKLNYSYELVQEVPSVCRSPDFQRRVGFGALVGHRIGSRA